MPHMVPVHIPVHMGHQYIVALLLVYTISTNFVELCFHCWVTTSKLLDAEGFGFVICETKVPFRANQGLLDLL